MLLIPFAVSDAPQQNAERSFRLLVRQTDIVHIKANDPFARATGIA
jgi:hypothetical protein